MKKRSSWDLAVTLGKTVKEIIEAGERVTAPEERKALGKHFWYSPEAAERIKQSFSDPLTVARRYTATGLHVARNPRWLFCRIEGVDGKHPVVIPRKLKDRLLDKRFEVEAIEDINGITYRHASLGNR